MFDHKSLEFELYKSYLEKAFSSFYAKMRLSLLVPAKDSSSAKNIQTAISESIDFCGRYAFEIEDEEEYDNFYKKLEDPLSSYEPVELKIFSRFFQYMAEIKRMVEKCGYASLVDFSYVLDPMPVLVREINKQIDDKGNVNDNATETLYSIRTEIKSIRKDIHKKLNVLISSSNADKFVQEGVITERNGRFTVPCKGNFRQYFQGIVHDRSGSGQTFFVEPSETVQNNNRHHELLAMERDEVLRIIHELIRAVRRNLDTIITTTENFKELIFFIELGRFFKKYKHEFPEFTGRIVFNKVHHPIIYFEKRNDSIPIDLEFNKNMAVITGPNTGGKTAGLKNIGLNHIVAMCGLPLFAQSAEVIFAKGIFADIGDNQSLVMDLSTFSSHMVNIGEIVKNAGEGCIVLLDEAGTGTEPKEGAALAVAVCSRLLEKGAKVFVTTHFSEVKNFALSNQNVEIYAVDFDYKTFEPKYRLIKGVSGKSDPLLIAKRLGFPEDIVRVAENIIKEQRSMLDMEVDEINKLKASSEARNIETERILEKVQLREQELYRRETELAKRLNMKETQLLEEAAALLAKAKRLSEQAGKGKKLGDEIDEHVKKAKNKLSKTAAERKPLDELKVGDIIYLDKYSKTGKILEISGNKVFMDMQGLKVSFARQDIVGKKVEEKDRVKNVQVSERRGQAERSEIVIVGKRVEEAHDILDKHIDESVLAGFNKIFIVHGRGTGQLRKAVHEYLRTDPRVKKYAIADNENGGQAVTIAEI